MYVILFIYHYIRFANVLSERFTCMFIREVGLLTFLYCTVLIRLFISKFGRPYKMQLIRFNFFFFFLSIVSLGVNFYFSDSLQTYIHLHSPFCPVAGDKGSWVRRLSLPPIAWNASALYQLSLLLPPPFLVHPLLSSVLHCPLTLALSIIFLPSMTLAFSFIFISKPF